MRGLTLVRAPLRALLALAAFGLSAGFQAPASAQPTLAAPVGKPAAGTYLVHVIDVGTGLSVFVEGADFTLLFDAGSNDDYGRGSKDRVLAYLKLVRPDLTRIDHLILSHPHKDHHEMMDDVLAAYSVGNVWDSGSLNDTCGYRAFLDAVIAEPRVVYHDALGSGGTHDVTFTSGGQAKCHGKVRPAGLVRVPRGSRISSVPIQLGAGATMTILHADGTMPSSDLNDASIVVSLALGSRRILLSGDEQAQGGTRSLPTVPPTASSTEGKLLACCKPQLTSDLLVVPHHGSKTSSRDVFLDAVHATDFVVSVGPKAYSGTILPDSEVIADLKRRGRVWRTDTNDKRLVPPGAPACESNPAKVGPDADGKPGGCDNVVAIIDASGAMATDYFRGHD
jgi:beta-lactamase superfamily II metal-dependent hydrolase